MKHNFEERKQNRIDYAKEQAVKKAKEANRLHSEADKMASAVPMGQPILVGHHSEKRHRNHVEKMHNKLRKAFEMEDKAKYYENKAESIEQNDAIFSDDPDAIEKLTKKLESLKDSHEFMKAANKCIKKNDREGFLKLPFATDSLWTKLTTPNYMGYTGFASYKLSNSSANIRNVEKRIEHLKRQNLKVSTDVIINGIRIFENQEANRLQLIFEGKPSEDIRKKLKSMGFRWAPSECAWQRHINSFALYQAKEFAESIQNQ